MNEEHENYYPYLSDKLLARRWGISYRTLQGWRNRTLSIFALVAGSDTALKRLLPMSVSICLALTSRKISTVTFHQWITARRMSNAGHQFREHRQNANR